MFLYFHHWHILLRRMSQEPSFLRFQKLFGGLVLQWPQLGCVKLLKFSSVSHFRPASWTMHDKRPRDTIEMRNFFRNNYIKLIYSFSELHRHRVVRGYMYVYIFVYVASYIYECIYVIYIRRSYDASGKSYWVSLLHLWRSGNCFAHSYHCEQFRRIL